MGGELLDAPNPPTALFCASDLLAFGAIGGAWRTGLRVPEDVSVVGFDDVEEAADSFPTLTTVRQPAAEMTDRAVGLLAGLIGDLDAERSAQVVLPELVVRGSTGTPPPR